MVVRNRSVLLDSNHQNTYKRVLSLLSYTGDIGLSIYRLMEIDYDKWNRTISRMMKERTYKISSNDNEIIKLRLCRKTAPRHYPISYSLTTEAYRSGLLDILGFQYQTYYEKYHAHTREHIKASIRSKNIQLAEITVILHHFDTLIYPHEKNIPEIFFDEQYAEIKLSPDFIPPTHNVFYSSVEIKRYLYYLYKDSIINIARGIYRGIWFNNNRGYIVYYQTEKPIKRDYIPEKRTTILAEDFIKSASPHDRKMYQGVSRSIIIGKRNCSKAIKGLLQDKNIVGISLYDHEHFVPVEHYKEVMPWIMCENYEKFVNEHIIKSKVPHDKAKLWHGINKKNEKTVCLLDFNLTLIQKLKMVAEQTNGEKYRAICYDWQAPLLREYFENTVKISIINKMPDNLYKLLNIKTDL